jgi:hypothetical protein
MPDIKRKAVAAVLGTLLARHARNRTPIQGAVLGRRFHVCAIHYRMYFLRKEAGLGGPVETRDAAL